MAHLCSLLPTKIGISSSIHEDRMPDVCRTLTLALALTLAQKPASDHYFIRTARQMQCLGAPGRHWGQASPGRRAGPCG